VPVAELVDPANRLSLRHPSGQHGPAFRAGGMLVWGFTAGLLDALLRAGGWERPWHRSRVEDLPDDVVALARRGGQAAVPADPEAAGPLSLDPVPVDPVADIGLDPAEPSAERRRHESAPRRGQAL
jgi:hypothetical protein